MIRSERFIINYFYIKTQTWQLQFSTRHFQCILLNENVWISLTILLNCVPKVRMNNTPALVQILTWRRSGDKPLSEPMMMSLLMHICVTRPHGFNSPQCIPFKCLVLAYMFLGRSHVCSYLDVHRITGMLKSVIKCQGQGQTTGLLCKQVHFIEFQTWMSNSIHTKISCLFTNHCPNLNNRLIKPPLILQHGCAITSHRNLRNAFIHPHFNFN